MVRLLYFILFAFLFSGNMAFAQDTQKIRELYKAKRKDTIFGISRMFNITIFELMDANPVMEEQGYELKRGAIIRIPYHQEAPKKEEHVKLYELGEKYFYGDDVEQNYSEALKYYIQAAEKGNLSALVCLGNMYEKGIGVNQDYQNAFSYFTQAFEKGEMYAGGCLGEMYYYGWYVSKDYNKAFGYLTKAANNTKRPSIRAMRLLAACYRYGLGTEKNNEKETYWMEQAEKSQEKNKHLRRTII